MDGPTRRIAPAMETEREQYSLACGATIPRVSDRRQGTPDFAAKGTDSRLHAEERTFLKVAPAACTGARLPR
jgi:hypothetical protein